jgi:hypothetical protein
MTGMDVTRWKERVEYPLKDKVKQKQLSNCAIQKAGRYLAVNIAKCAEKHYQKEQYLQKLTQKPVKKKKMTNYLKRNMVYNVKKAE